MTKTCAKCRVTYTAETWAALPCIGSAGHELYVLEYRNCPCGSTLCHRTGPSPQLRTAVAAMTYEEVVTELDYEADNAPDLAHWLREVASSRHRTVELMGSSRAPSTAELRAMLVREIEADHG